MTQSGVDKFVKAFGRDRLESICEAAWARENRDGVKFSEHVMMNAANYLHAGSFDKDGKEWFFKMEQGDWNGCVIEWNDEPIGAECTPLRFVFVPIDPETSTAKALFARWKRQEWFKEMEGKMNYDFAFAPGFVTRDHYGKWAKKKGMRIEIAH